MGKLENQIKFLVAELKKSKKKKAKKKAKTRSKPRKTKTSLAEYAKNKMMLDMLTKSQLGGAGGGIQPLKVNYDTETVKKELSDLKEKMRDEKTKVSDEVKRLETGLEQYQRQLALEYEDRGNPRGQQQGFVGMDGEMLRLTDLQQVYEQVQSQIGNLNNQIKSLDSQRRLSSSAKDQRAIEEQKKQLDEQKKKLEVVKESTKSQMDDISEKVEARKKRGQKAPTLRDYIDANQDSDLVKAQNDLLRDERQTRRMAQDIQDAKDEARRSASGRYLSEEEQDQVFEAMANEIKMNEQLQTLQAMKSPSAAAASSSLPPIPTASPIDQSLAAKPTPKASKSSSSSSSSSSKLPAPKTRLTKEVANLSRQ